ncbi:MAG: hypothetical protein R3E32_14230 [Chitinophagales bacterium]
MNLIKQGIKLIKRSAGEACLPLVMPNEEESQILQFLIDKAHQFTL